MRTFVPNMEGVPHPPLRSVVSLVCEVGQVSFESIGYNFGCMAASDSLFDRFSGSSYPLKT